MKVAIIGCGKVADAHVGIVSTMSQHSIVAVCDREELMARQMQERYKIKYCYTDAAKLLDEAKPDAVHITTPPGSHYSLGKLCLEAGRHIFVEKPFTLDTKEAEELIAIATAKNLKVTVGTNIQFSDAANRVRALVNSGFLGGPPVHIEHLFCYSLGDDFAKAFLGDETFWVRKLPGKLLHNIISHGIARIAEFLSDDDPRVIATAFPSKTISAFGAKDVQDELRTIIVDSSGTTAYFTFSSQIGPSMHQFRLYGPKRSIIVDDDQQTVIKIQGNSLKSYASFFFPPMSIAKQYMQNSFGNISSFLKRKLYTDAGKIALIDAFYQSIEKNSPPPISYPEILRTSRIMDSIFNQIAESGMK